MSSTNNKALTPVADTDRVFHWHEHASLWFSLGVGLLVIQIGAYLVPAVGSRDALIAIVLGSIVGSGLLAWTAKLGCDSGLSSAGLMGATFGSHFARLPVILKGILHPDDALEAARLRVDGLIVSNHGGRTLDTALPTAAALPAIAEALEGRLPLLVDGGIRRGTDVLKALALGASAVLVGRPYIFGLANAGALGVAHVIRLLRDELEIAMALCGCRTLDDIGPELLIAPG